MTLPTHWTPRRCGVASIQAMGWARWSRRAAQASGHPPIPKGEPMTTPDSETTAPVGTTVLFENQRLRVWELLLAPGQTCQPHQHLHDHLLLYAEPATIRAQLEGRPVLHIQDGLVSYRVWARRAPTARDHQHRRQAKPPLHHRAARPQRVRRAHGTRAQQSSAYRADPRVRRRTTISWDRKEDFIAATPNVVVLLADLRR
jgi:hypothetical protein